MLTLPLAAFFMKLVWRMYNTGTVYMSTHSNMLLRQVLKASMELKSRYKVALWENSLVVSKLFYGTEPWNHQQMCALTKIFGLFERKRQNFRKIMNFWSDLYFWYHITGTMLKRVEFNWIEFSIVNKVGANIITRVFNWVLGLHSASYEINHCWKGSTSYWLKIEV